MSRVTVLKTHQTFYCSLKGDIKLKTLADLFSDIIHRCKHGDRKAQESVYNLLAAKMFAVCLRYCHNHQEAEDVLHDGFMTVFTKINQFQHSGSFEGWVRRIFVNHALERYRNNAKIPVVEDIDNVDYLLAVPETAEEEEWAAYQLSETELLELIRQLPQQYKMVFNLYVVEGLSHKEISETLGIAEGTSRSNLLRARSILQKQVTDLVKSMSYKQQCK
ncbi:MAG: RNA polymerase sigma factor [Bacteroidales bacterium]|jgi:RNA polymerase sigma-70 factor (ECF subfamily)|nr:RNA polymerase sigma factor [Bacteroidales bacterium]